MRILLLFAACLSLALTALAEEGNSGDSIHISAGFQQTLSSGDHSPFWLAANKHGLSSVDRGFGYVEVGAFKPLEAGKRFSWSAGIDIAVPWKFTSDFVVQQLFAEVRYRCMSLSVGSKYYEEYRVTDPFLSSGALLYSGNARPVPQVRFGIPQFQPLKFTDNYVSLKGYVAYGMSTDSRWQKNWAAPGSQYNKNILFCSRGIWIKAGDATRFPLEFTGGIELGTQFGGTIYNHDLYDAGINFVTVKMPTDLEAWFKALIPLGGRKSTIVSEANNIEGNTVGAYDMSLSWTFDSGWKVKAYWQHMFEDHSQMFFQFPWKDGMWGAQAWLPKNPFVSSMVYEFIYSKFQSGPVYNDTCPDVPEQVSGVDMYYHNYLYNGWMHWGMGIGNPFSISPIYNSDHKLDFSATRNISHHIGVTGSPLQGLDYRVLVSNTRSWGTYYVPFPEVREMWNFLAEVKWRPSFMKNFQLQLALAFDRGDLIDDNFGGMVGVEYVLPIAMTKR